jgi:hypothetical protein
MTPEEAREYVLKRQVQLVYVSGKTCSGKTTFASGLEKEGYARIELDEIVMDSVVHAFHVEAGVGFLTAYRGEGPEEQTRAFIVAAQKYVSDALEKGRVVVEGAIATAQIFNGVFGSVGVVPEVLYFHPKNISEYSRRIIDRFISAGGTRRSGLPKDFWETISMDDVSLFQKTGILGEKFVQDVHAYAISSQKKSEQRLQHLQEYVPELQVVTF